MKQTSLLRTTLLILTSVSSAAYARPDGIAGRTDTTAARSGCGGCHGATATESVIATLTGPTDVSAGSTHVYTLTLTGGPLVNGGINASATAGVLVPGEGTKLLDGELVHSEPKAALDGSVRFEFQLTAPPEAGTIVLKAVGNSGNGDGDASSDDKWNFAAPLSITVAAAEPAPQSGNDPAPIQGQPPVPLEPMADSRDAQESAGCAAAGSSLSMFALLTSGLLLRRRKWQN